MVKKTKVEWQIFVPDIYLGVYNKSKKLSNVILLESLLDLSRELDLDIKELCTAYFLIVLTLIYGGQLKCNSKLIVDKSNKSLSLEKVFQQTISHGNITRILSNSKLVKKIQALYAIQYGIDNNAFGITEYERSSKEAVLSVIKETYLELINNKGSGSSKASIRRPETRIEALRAKMASLRSKWCSAPTYGVNKLCTSGMSIKNMKNDDIFGYVNTTCNKWIEDNQLKIRNSE